MSLRVYNTLTRDKEIFQPIVSGKVSIYLCGPTVYKPPHLGHMVGPVIFDAIKRYLLYKGYEVTLVINITDVEDKLIDASVKTGTSVEALSARYTTEYLECLQQLGVDTVDYFPRATDHMPEIIQLCATLIENGCAYPSDGNVYFDVSRDNDYGKLSKRKVEESEAGLRTVESAGKRNPADFAIWKAVKSPAAGEPVWESPWGPGRPGWHIECSAMSMKYLGQTFDMHGGGLDLLFPHHENELAQSECATGKPFVRFWMHNGLTRIKTKMAGGEWANEKMSGSLGNVVSAQELIEKYGADLLRYMLLSTHYRRPIEFNDDVMTSARKGLAVFHRLIERIERLSGKRLENGSPDMKQASTGLMATDLADFARTILSYKMKFLEMMDDDFNTAGGIAVMHELAGEVNAFIEKNALEREKKPQQVEAASAAVMTMRNMGTVLGLFRQPTGTAARKDTHLTDQLMQLLIALRRQARQDKNFSLADAIRNGLSDLGVTLEDRADGTVWRKE